jgi:hypothetical protein
METHVPSLHRSLPPPPSSSWRKQFWKRAALLLAIATCSGSSASFAGGGPENLFLVVNPESPESVAIANTYVALRQIPPINVMMLPWTGSREETSVATFRKEILDPVLEAIEGRRLVPQIDAIVYSSDFPWRINFKDELPEPLVGVDKFPAGSLTGMTTLFPLVKGTAGGWVNRESNRYYRPLNVRGVPRETRGFRSWYGWGSQGEQMEAGGVRYLLSAMLGVTNGRGNSVDEIIAMLRSATAADETHPKGTIYFVTNSDVRTTTRSSVFNETVTALKELGVEAEVVSGTLPVGKRTVAGLMTGTPSFDWPASGSRVTPGAICENLTSFGGIFSPSAGQTPLSEFLRAGAAGSSGTVIEPYADQAKFPHPSIQVHYARGASLIEAFYQSVQSPYQLLVVGDPLCQPWANIPRVQMSLASATEPLAAGAVLSGEVTLTATAQVSSDAQVDRFEIFVDGMRYAQFSAGDTAKLDTAQLADGYHEIRMVGVTGSLLETQGRQILPVTFANHGRALQMKVEPQQVPLSGNVRISLVGRDIDGAVLYAAGRVLGRTTEAESSIEIPASMLGQGPATIRATGRRGNGQAGSVHADPVTVMVLGK